MIFFINQSFTRQMSKMASEKEKNFIKAWLETYEKTKKDYDWEDKIILSNRGETLFVIRFDSSLSSALLVVTSTKQLIMSLNHTRLGLGFLFIMWKFITSAFPGDFNHIFIKYLTFFLIDFDFNFLIVHCLCYIIMFFLLTILYHLPCLSLSLFSLFQNIYKSWASFSNKLLEWFKD